MFLPWGNQTCQDSKCAVIMSLVLNAVSWKFNPLYFSVAQLLGDFLTEQALRLQFRTTTSQAISSLALLVSLSRSCRFS